MMDMLAEDVVVGLVELDAQSESVVYEVGSRRGYRYGAKRMRVGGK